MPKRTFATVGGSQVTSTIKRTRKAKPMYKKRTTSSSQPGKVAPNSTTLATYPVPFPPRKMVNFIYENGLVPYAPGVAKGVLSVALNSLFDFDLSSSYFGNKQPLFYDKLMAGGGPYRFSKVISWKTTFTIVNTSDVPLNIFMLPPTTAASEIDLISEAENYPGVKRLYLSPRTGSKTTGTLTNLGHISDCYDLSIGDEYLRAPYNGAPTNICFGGLFIQTADDTTALGCFVAVKHEAYTELSGVDAEVS